MKTRILSLSLLASLASSSLAIAAPNTRKVPFDDLYPAQKIGVACEAIYRQVASQTLDLESKLRSSLQDVLRGLPPQVLETMDGLQQRLLKSQARLDQAMERATQAGGIGKLNRTSALYREYQAAFYENSALFSLALQLKDAIQTNPVFRQDQKDLAEVGVTLEVRELEDRHIEIAVRHERSGLVMETRNGYVTHLLAPVENEHRMLEAMPSECALYLVMKSAASR